jgi:2-polyprenyl-3-methyl-5-hydroxy-6-metoxy-1,4-benzoquinol methylase
MDYNYQNTINTFHVLAKQWQNKYMDLDLYNDTYEVFCNVCEKPDASVFEVGCGPGNIAKYILARYPGFRIYGTDAAPAMVELARQNNPAARFDVLDCRHISSIAGKFDAVICGFCLPYLAKPDAAKLIDDAAGLLVQNGVFYLSTIEDDYANSRLQTSSNGQHSAHQFFYRENDLLEMLNHSGFMVQHTFRKHLQKPDGGSETGIILIARKK